VTARLLLLAAMFPLAGLAQLELAWAATGDPIPPSYNLGTAAVCQTLQSPQILLLNPLQDPINVTTLDTFSAVIAVSEAPTPPFAAVNGVPRAFYINFTPTGSGPFNVTLTVAGTDAVTLAPIAPLNVALSATGMTAPTLTDSSGNSYCPGASINVGRTQVGTTVQTTLTLVNTTQSAVTAAVSGTDFGLATPVTVAAGATQPLSITFTPSIPNAETGTLTVNGLVYNLTGQGFVAPLPQPTLTLSANCCQSATQAQVSIAVPAAATSPESGTLTLAFQPAANLPNDPNIVFTATGTPTMSVQVNPGAMAQYTFQTGTTAGTIALTLALLPAASGVTASTSTTILPAIVALDLSTAVPATDEIIVSLAGFDNTHAASSLSFTFYDTTGKAIPPGLIQADVTSAFASYHTANPRAGGTFNLQATFPVTGDITQVATVDVQFKNPAGITDTGPLPVQ